MRNLFNLYLSYMKTALIGMAASVVLFTLFSLFRNGINMKLPMVIAVLVVSMLAILVLAVKLYTLSLGITPFQRAVMRIKWLRWFSHGKAYDAFVSYKSGDAVVARQFAESFVACGLTPWFAEYTISIPERERFGQAIDLGVRNSRFGVCLTNEKYFASKYCECERKGLLKNCGSDRVIEVKLDPTYNSQKVPWAASLTYQTVQQTFRDVAEIAGFHLDLSGEPTEPVRQHTHTRTAFPGHPGMTGPYSLDLSQWEILPREHSITERGHLLGPAFKRWCNSDLMWGHLIIGPQDPRVRRKLMPMGAFDDREYYEEALKFADEFYKNQLPQRCVGVHLFFLDGWSHVALTSFFQEKGTWARVYSLVFPSTDGGADIEFAFFFFMREPFRHFCRRAHLMDELVASLQKSDN